MANIAVVSTNTGSKAATRTRTALQGLGHTVTLVSDANFLTTDFDPYDLVVLTLSQADATGLRALLDGEKPLLIGMVDIAAVGSGNTTRSTLLDLTGTIEFTSGATSMEVIDNTHEITDEFSLGFIGVFKTNGVMGAVDVGQSFVGDELTRGSINGSRASTIAIERETLDLLGNSVNARVVVTSAVYGENGDYSADGITLVGAAVEWLTVEFEGSPGTPSLEISDISLTTAVLTGSAFSTGGSAHASSRWRVFATEDDSLVFDSGEDTENLESISASGLPENTALYATVVYTSEGDLSAESDPVAFSTLATWTACEVGDNDWISCEVPDPDVSDPEAISGLVLNEPIEVDDTVIFPYPDPLDVWDLETYNWDSGYTWYLSTSGGAPESAGIRPITLDEYDSPHFIPAGSYQAYLSGIPNMSTGAIQFVFYLGNNSETKVEFCFPWNPVTNSGYFFNCWEFFDASLPGAGFSRGYGYTIGRYDNGVKTILATNETSFMTTLNLLVKIIVENGELRVWRGPATPTTLVVSAEEDFTGKFSGLEIKTSSQAEADLNLQEVIVMTSNLLRVSGLNPGEVVVLSGSGFGETINAASSDEATSTGTVEVDSENRRWPATKLEILSGPEGSVLESHSGTFWGGDHYSREGILLPPTAPVWASCLSGEGAWVSCE